MKRRYIATGLAAAGIALLGAPAAHADEVSCDTDYYSNALWTTCSDGSTSVCYDGGSCHYTSAADRAADRNSRQDAYKDLLRGAGICNVMKCVN